MDKDEVKKIAELSRLDINDDELEKVAKDMGSILEYIDKIKSVEIDDQSAEARIESAGVRNVMVEDENPHAAGMNTKEVLDSAPETEKDFVKVKKILNNDNA
jgi:aspartyl-tRNA(Asn)/glutamyl-tRNA(Gln) amidotransferase subunit C